MEMHEVGDFDDLLIDAVRVRPYLYNIKDRKHKDTKLKENAWAAIGDLLGISGEDAKRRWFQLRDNFQRFHRRRKHEISSVSGATDDSEYPDYYKKMLFYLNFWNVKYKRPRSYNMHVSESHPAQSPTFSDTHSISQEAFAEWASNVVDPQACSSPAANISLSHDVSAPSCTSTTCTTVYGNSAGSPSTSIKGECAPVTNTVPVSSKKDKSLRKRVMRRPASCTSENDAEPQAFITISEHRASSSRKEQVTSKRKRINDFLTYIGYLLENVPEENMATCELGIIGEIRQHCM